MVFSDFKTRQMAFDAFQLDSRIEEFVQPVPHRTPAFLVERINMVRRANYVNNEFGTAEGLIFPVLLEAWTNYFEVVMVWNRREFGKEDLHGSADYVFSRIPHRGYQSFSPPYACIVEAKQEKFEEGWGQCIAAMVAAQRLNGLAELPVFGAVTIGTAWQFGRLHDQTFTLDPQDFALVDLDHMVGAVRFLFEQAKNYPLPMPFKRSA